MEPIKPLEDCKTINEMRKSLRGAVQMQRAIEEATKKYNLEKIYSKILKELYGINTNSEEATKKKI